MTLFADHNFMQHSNTYCFSITLVYPQITKQVKQPRKETNDNIWKNGWSCA